MAAQRAALDHHADRARAAHRAGLAQLERTCCTPNSSRMIARTRSASVSDQAEIRLRHELDQALADAL
jgi:hypothetical protein